MVKGLLSYLKFGNRYSAIEQTEINGDTLYYGIGLEKKRKQLHIETHFSASKVEDLNKEIPKNRPIVLVINNSSVLTKKIESIATETLKAVHLAFPNIQIDEFYYQVLKQGNFYFISICRKAYVEDLLKFFADNNIIIIDIALGNLIATSVSGFFDADEFCTSNATIALDENFITSITPFTESRENTYTINGLEVKNLQLLSFAAALGLAIESSNLESNFSATKQTLSETFIQKRFANQFLKISFGLLFFVLLINTFFFFHYQDKVNALSETSLVLEISKNKVIGLNQKVQKAQKKVEDVLKGSSSKSSFYVDAIIKSLPETLLLDELNYQPLLKRIKDDKPIENDKNNIQVSGSSNNRNDFSEWISELESINWIAGVEILGFEDVSAASSGFIIKIKMDYETEN